MSQAPYNQPQNQFNQNVSPNYMPPPDGGFEQYQQPDNKFPCAIAAAIFGVLGLMLLLVCGGFFALLMYYDNSIVLPEASNQFDNVITRQLHQEVIINGVHNRQMVDELRKIDSLSSRIRLENDSRLDEINSVLSELATAVENSEDTTKFLDGEAMAEALERKGCEIAAYERRELERLLKQRSTPDVIGNDYRVIQIQPTATSGDVRVLVASDSGYSVPPFVTAFWLRKKTTDWKLYDWQDLNTPLSEIDYFKTAIELNDPYRTSFGEMTQAIGAASQKEGISVEETIEAITRARKQHQLPLEFRELGNDFVGHFYCAYGAEKEVEQLLSEMPRTRIGTELPFRAWLQYRQNKSDALFQTLNQIEAIFGWHPILGRYAPNVPSTGRARFKAITWMQKSALVFPEQFNLSSYLDIADQRDVDRLVAALVNGSDPKKKIAKLEENSYYLASDELEKWTNALLKEPRLKPFAIKGQFRMAMSEDDYDDATQKALLLLDTDISDTEFTSIQYDLVKCGTRTKSLDRLLAKYKHPKKFVQFVAESAAYEYRIQDDQIIYVSDFCERHIDDIENKDDSVLLRLVRSRVAQKNGNHKAAIDLLLPVVNRSWELGSEPYESQQERTYTDSDEEFLSSNFYTIATTLMNSGVNVPSRLAEVLDSIPDRQVALLAACATDDLDMQTLRAIFTWYGKGSENFEVWSSYYRAQIAVKDEDIPAAIALYERSIGPTLSDDWSSALYEAPFVYDFAPFEDDFASEVRSLQFDLAMRGNHWNKLFAGLESNDDNSKRGESLANELLWRFSSSREQTLMTRLLTAMNEIDSQSPLAKVVVAYLRGRLALLKGALPEAAEKFRQALKEIEQSESEISTYHVYSNLTKCVLDSSVKLTDDEITKIEDDSLSPQLDLNLAIVGAKKWDELDSESYVYQYASPSPLQRIAAERSRNLTRLLATLKGTTTSGLGSGFGAIFIEASDENLPGKLRELLQFGAAFEEFGRYENDPTDAFENDILSWKANQRIGSFSQLDASRFPGYSHVYRAAINVSADSSKRGGWLIAGVADDPAKFLEYSDFTDSDPSQQVIAFQLIDDHGIINPVGVIRQYGLLFTTRLGEGTLFYDNSSDQVFDQGDAASEIQKAMRGESFRASNKSIYLYSYVDVSEDEIDERSKSIRTRLFTELVPVRSERPGGTVRLREDSQILPWLKEGMEFDK